MAQAVQVEDMAGALPEGAVPIDVAYAEKDRAKAQGARWDTGLKSWYVPAGVDLEGFGEWLPVDVDAERADLGIDDTEAGPRVTARLLGMRLPCWKCDRSTVSVVGLQQGDADLLLLDSELGKRVARALLTEAVMVAANVGKIEKRYVKKLNRRCVTIGCHWCDALQADKRLFADDMAEVLSAGSPALEELVTADLPVGLWQRVEAARVEQETAAVP